VQVNRTAPPPFPSVMVDELYHTRTMPRSDLELQHDQVPAVLPILQRKYPNTEETSSVSLVLSGKSEWKQNAGLTPDRAEAQTTARLRQWRQLQTSAFSAGPNRCYLTVLLNCNALFIIMGQEASLCFYSGRGGAENYPSGHTHIACCRKSLCRRHAVCFERSADFYLRQLRFNVTFAGNERRFEKSFTKVLQMLLCGECCENVYNSRRTNYPSFNSLDDGSFVRLSVQTLS
jgi:hypothetical protein